MKCKYVFLNIEVTACAHFKSTYHNSKVCEESNQTNSNNILCTKQDISTNPLCTESITE